MLIFQIKECMLQKGFKPTVTALIRIGIAQRSAYRYLNGTSKVMSPDHLYKLCIYLNCTPKELMRVELPPGDKSLDDHPLKEWAVRPKAFPLQQFRQLTPDQLKQAQVAIDKIIAGETVLFENL